jgi:tetratricopeptide (TPR) repeat protein
VAADGSKNHTPGGGGGQAPGASPTSPSVRLRAEEVVERGLRLYAHGDLEGALAEWRRALELDHGNRRGRDYVTYVEDHFEVLNEKFRAARERRGAGGGPAIEIVADDPMDDIDPYESIELEGALAREGAGEIESAIAALESALDSAEEAAERDEGEPDAATGPAPEAPHLHSGAAGGKHGAGRRPWGGRRGRDSDDHWPIDDSWPRASRNDTLEMTVDPSCLDDLDEIGAGPDPGDLDIEASGVDDADAEVEADEAELEDLFGRAPIFQDDDEAGETGERDRRDAGSGEITLPARRRWHGGPSNAPRAEGSGPVEAPDEQGHEGRPRTTERRPPQGLALGDFGVGVARPTVRDPESRPPPEGERAETDTEAWADGTPPVEDADDEALAELRALREEELREVRVTFRRPRRGAALRRGEAQDEEARLGEEGRHELDEDGGEHRHADLDDRDDGDDGTDGGFAGAEPTESDESGGEGVHMEVDVDGGDGEEDDEETAERPSPRAELAAGRRADADNPVSASSAKLREALLSLDREEDPFDATATLERVDTRARAPALASSESERATTQMRDRRVPLAHSSVSIELVSADLMSELDQAMAAVPQTGEEEVRERVTWLIERARHENREGHYPVAVVAIDLALDENPESAVTQKLIHSHRELLFEIYANYLGDMNAVPGLALPMTSIPELDQRAAFLLSRVDGVLSLEDVLDVAGMARLEAFRHLSRLMLRGILEIRP